MSPSVAHPWWRNRRTAASTRLVRRHGAALARRHDLARVEGEAGGDTERAAGRSAVPGAQRAGGVLEERDLLRHRRLQRLPLDRAAEEVNRHDGARPRGHGGGDRRGIDDERIRVDVDEHRARAAELDDIRRRGKGVRGNDDLVTRPDLEREQREMERSGARRDRRGVCGSDRSASAASNSATFGPIVS